jgi:hypothetical protein
MFVFIDGASRESSMNRAIDIVSEMILRPVFGRTRHIYTFEVNSLITGRPGTGFEGWMSELRLVNRTMLGGEAYDEMSNASAWYYSYSMNGCSGENHTGTDIAQFDMQQAWLICSPPPLRVCGSASFVGSTLSRVQTPSGFKYGEQAGCFCGTATGNVCYHTDVNSASPSLFDNPAASKFGVRVGFDFRPACSAANFGVSSLAVDLTLLPTCTSILGFCDPNQDLTRLCCAVAGCEACFGYWTCSSCAYGFVNVTAFPSVCMPLPTTTSSTSLWQTTMTTLITSSPSTAKARTSVPSTSGTSALPTCGTTTSEFLVGELAGCYCLAQNQTRTCVTCEWSANETVVARPMARWLLSDGVGSSNSTVVSDSSGNNFNGHLMGTPNVDYRVQSSFVSFLKLGYIAFNDSTSFNFGVRNFALEASVRVGPTAKGGVIIGKRLSIGASSTYHGGRSRCGNCEYCL